jgi:hypothetical protein
MFLSEHHAVLLANRDAPLDDRTHVFGRLPSRRETYEDRVALDCVLEDIDNSGGGTRSRCQ